MCECVCIDFTWPDFPVQIVDRCEALNTKLQGTGHLHEKWMVVFGKNLDLALDFLRNLSHLAGICILVFCFLSRGLAIDRFDPFQCISGIGLHVRYLAVWLERQAKTTRKTRVAERKPRPWQARLYQMFQCRLDQASSSPAASWSDSLLATTIYI